MKRRKKKQQGHIKEKIHLEQNMMRAKNGRREERHYLRERAAPGGRADACGGLITQMLSEFHRFLFPFFSSEFHRLSSKFCLIKMLILSSKYRKTEEKNVRFELDLSDSLPTIHPNSE